MRYIVLFLFFLTLGSAAGYLLARRDMFDPFVKAVPTAVAKEDPLAFRPAPYLMEHHPFCIIIVGRNNGAYLEKTLQSAVSQNYDNFRIIYVDDASDDGSFELANERCSDAPFVQVVHNQQPLGMLASLVHAIHSCSNEEIVVVLHGEDWLSHSWVLQRLNQYYADPDLWLTYGKSCEYPTFQTDSLNAYPPREGSFPFKALHPNTFYAGLFKKIHLADLSYKEEHFQIASELAYMFPMLEMAKGHSQCLPDVLYILNNESEARENSVFLERRIRSLKSYERLTALSLAPNEA